MPFKSDSQRRFLFAKHPDIAKKFASKEHSSEGNSSPKPSNFSTTVHAIKETNEGRARGEAISSAARSKRGSASTILKLDSPRRRALLKRLAKNRKNT